APLVAPTSKSDGADISGAGVILPAPSTRSIGLSALEVTGRISTAADAATRASRRNDITSPPDPGFLFLFGHPLTHAGTPRNHSPARGFVLDESALPTRQGG